MKKIVYIVVLVIIVVSIFAYKFFTGKKDQYIFYTVNRSTVTEIVSESGAVSSSSKVSLYSPTNGVIDKIFVSNGDLVKERQKLFSVKSTATPQEKAETYALYQAARSAVQQAENNRRSTIATVNRVHDDLKDHDKDETYLQKETRTAAEVANDNAWDALLAAQAQLASAQANYLATQNSTVVAPISGSVSNISVITGSGVSINSPLSPVNPILAIGTDSATEIVIAIGESDINKIKVGQDAEIRFDAVENKVYKGIVVRYDSNGTVTQGVAKFNVYISVSDSDENLKTGMTADADITTNKLNDVLSVPNTAIKPYQKGRAVRVLGKNNAIEFIPVKIGIKGKENTQILEGITEGQKIIVSLSGEKATKTSFF